MEIKSKTWINFSIFNLLLVTILGVIMRYKIGFEFPYLDQKNIQHAHSHFAFSGWITQTLYLLLIRFLLERIPNLNTRPYYLLLSGNLICAFGMLFSFAVGGYSAVSIAFSTLSILIACVFTYIYFSDLKKLTIDKVSSLWLKAALSFHLLSSIGTFNLAQMMVTHNYDQNLYLASVYFYLHFQYNGFFIFSILGLVYSEIHKILPAFKMDSKIFNLFLASVIPAYFLSILWAKLPIWLYSIVIVSAFVQVFAWILFLLKVKRGLFSIQNLSAFSKYLFVFVACAFTIKLFLQLGSTIPSISKLAFGFRPIVIAYLHLVLLAVISIFLIAFMYSVKLIGQNKLSTRAILIFISGVFLNELALAVQGIASFSYTVIPMINTILFIISLILLLGIVLLFRAQLSSKSISLQGDWTNN